MKRNRTAALLTTDPFVTGGERALTPVDKVLCLQNVDVFKYATTEMLAYIGTIATEVTAQKGQIIFSEGDASDAMYIIISGRVRLEKNAREVLQVGASQPFGMWALFDRDPRLMTATVMEDARCLKIGSEAFYELLADHDEITPVIFRAVIERVKTLLAE